MPLSVIRDGLKLNINVMERVIDVMKAQPQRTELKKSPVTMSKRASKKEKKEIATKLRGRLSTLMPTYKGRDRYEEYIL